VLGLAPKWATHNIEDEALTVRPPGLHALAIGLE
jgi:hypothetical protein